MHYVYILRGEESDKHYTGMTHDLQRRLREHRLKLSPVTRSWGKLSLVWYGAFTHKTDAAAFEKYLKSGSGREYARRHGFYSGVCDIP